MPAVVGVPEMSPVLPSSESPAGRPPAVTDHDSGATPPLDCRVAVYPTFTDPFGSRFVVMSRCFATVMLSCCVAETGVGAESVTCTVNTDVPEAVGVPEITPVLVLSVNPAGRLPAGIDHERVPLPPLDCSLAL